jgi:outer membrane surface antigen
MRRAACLASLVVLLAAVSALALTPHVTAEEVKPAAPPPTCSCPSADPCPGKQPGLWVRPRYADSRALLDENDEIAALEAVRVALSEVGDGATYVWHRANGRLSGLVQPTASFKDPAGRVCRHIVLVMSTGDHTARTEGIACRLGDGRWQLDG